MLLISPSTKIFAIDLEAIDKSQDTLLIKKKSKNETDLVVMRSMALTKLKKELPNVRVTQLIENFNAEMGSSSLSFRFPVRYVLADTEFFRDTIKNVPDPDSIAQILTEKIIESMTEGGMSPIDDAEMIKKCVYKDLLNRDIPFFTEKEGVLYYGYANNGIKIGGRTGH